MRIQNKNAGADRYPEVQGGVVVWEGVGSSGTDNEVYFADVTASTVSVVELTSNDLKDRYPVINGGLITWCADGDDTDYEAYYYDLDAASPAIVQITDDEVDDWYPVSSGGVVAWSTDLAPWLAAP